MKILITGGAGFIGSHLAEHYYKQGHEVHVVDNFSTGKLENVNFLPIENIYNFEIQNRKLTNALLIREEYDIILHLAAVVSVVETIEKPLYSQAVNTNSTLNILECIRVNELKLKRFIFASSAAVYGNDLELPKKIGSAINPESPYAIQKFASEQYTLIYNKLYGIPSTSIRFFNVYGPRQNPESAYSGVISIMNNCFKEDKQFNFFGDGKQTRDFVYVKDLVKAIELLIDNKATEGSVFNLGTGEAVSLLEVFEKFKNIYNKNLTYTFKDERPGDIRDSYADISKLLKLGFNVDYKLEEGLKKYVEYELKEND